MRPLRLAVEGLTAFPTRQEIDLSRLGLFCITGATGAGKTTIFDAIAFALYGRAPRVAKRMRRLVASAASAASVELDFSVNGQSYRVSRRLRLTPSGGVQHRALLERLGGGTQPLADGADPVSAEVEQITGLDFESFTRAVMLPQGDFAELLSGEAAKRRAILVRLLDLSKVEDAGRRARSQADALRGQERLLKESLDGELADATLDALRSAKADLDAARARAAARDKALLRARGQEVLARDATARAEAAGRLGLALGDLASRDEAAAREASTIAPRVIEVEAAFIRADESCRKAEADLVACCELLDTTIRAHGDEALHATQRALLRELASADAELLASTAEITAAKEALAEAEKTIQLRRAQLRGAEQAAYAVAQENLAAAEDNERRCAAALAALATVRTEADSRLAHLERHHLGASIRELLTRGEPCPVCSQPVAETLPPVPGDLAARLTTARRDAASAQAKEADAVAVERSAHAASEAARHAVSVIAERIAALPGSEGHPDALPSKLGPDKAREAVSAAEKGVAGQAQRVSAACARVSAAHARRSAAEGQLAANFGRRTPAEAIEQALLIREEALAVARRRVTAAQSAFDVERTRREGAQRGRDALMATRAQLEAAAASHTDERNRLAGELRTLVPENGWSAVDDDARVLSEVARRLAETHAAEAASAVADIDHLATDLPRESGSGALGALDAAARAAAEDVARREVAVSTLRDRIRARGEREARIAQLAQQATLLESLALHLRSDRFMEFVLAESVETLCRHASARLLEMSGGRFSLVTDAEDSGGELLVVDHHNADETRSVTTLSGGETFQASLALALALSDSVAELGGLGRLDAVFVDEGFAALDAESLDLAIDALETVQAGGRMVGVITHMPQMAERIPEGLEVIKGVAGSSVFPRAA